MVATLNKPTVGEYELKSPTIQEYEQPEPQRISVWEPTLKERIRNVISSMVQRSPFVEPGKRLGQLGIHHLSEAVSGLGLYIPDVLASKITKEDTLASAIDKITGFEPTPRDTGAGEAAKFVTSLQSVGKVIGPAVAKIPAREALRTILSGGVQFGTRGLVEETSKLLTTDKPINWEKVHAEAGLGSLFGIAQASVSGLVNMREYSRFVKNNPAWKAMPRRYFVKMHEAMRAAQGGMGRNQWRKIYGKDVQGFLDAHRKILAKPMLKGGVTKAPKPAEITKAPPTVEEFGKYPIARPIKRPPTVPIKAPEPPSKAITTPKAKITPVKAEEIQTFKEWSATKPNLTEVSGRMAEDGYAHYLEQQLGKSPTTEEVKRYGKIEKLTTEALAQPVAKAEPAYKIGKKTTIEKRYFGDPRTYEWPGNEITLRDYPDEKITVYKTKSGWLIGYGKGGAFGKEREGGGWIGFDSKQKAIKSYIKEKLPTPREAEPAKVEKPEAKIEGNRYKGIDTASKEQLLKGIYEQLDVVSDKEVRLRYQELKESFTPEERKEFKDVIGVLDKQIAKAEQPPAQVKPKGKPGFVDVRPLLKVHKTFMGIVEPSKAVELKVGKEAYATVIKGVHEVDVGRIEFNEAQIEGQDKSLGQLSKWFNKFSEKELKNFMISRGEPTTEGARLIQRDAMGKLAKELRRGDLFQAVQRIADSNYKYLQSVVGDDIHRVEDYFYGIYKNPKQVDKFLDYWRTTKRFTKEKKLPTVADAIDYGLELRNYNPIENLKAEYIAISHLKGMNWMRDELLRTGKGKFIDETPDAPLEWDMVQDPVFKDLRLQPDLAKLINNLIATNKITRIPLANTLREINNVARTVKFVGSAFHLLSVAKQSIADSGYLGFLYKPTATRGLTRGFRTNDPIFRTTAYKDYVRHGGGHRYSVESEARRTFNRAVDELNRNMGKAVKVGALPLKIPTGFVNWMFQSYIPKVKYSKFLDVVAEQEKKLGRMLTSPEKIDIIKEQQNFYGMMNERLFGRSGTVTTVTRFWWMSPGYAEGNYRSMLKALLQWGGKSGFKANRSRSNIINSWLITGIAATVGTLAFTGKPPKKPETLDDARDLFKIDTGKSDEKGRKIMIDLMTYDKDYWNVAFNTLRLRPDVAIGKSWKRIGGMKAPTADIIVDLALMSMGKAVYDWKGDRVVEITDPFLLKAMKLTTHEIKKLVPISVSVFQQSKKRDIDTTVAAIETLLGFRPTKTEQDIREQKIISKMYSLAGQKEEMSYYIGQSTDPKRTVERYNKTVNNILNSPYIPKSMKAEWGPKLLVDYEKVVTWKRFPAGKMTNAELQRAYDAHTLSVPYKRRGEPFRQIGAPKKGSERRVSELKAEAQKRDIELKRGPRKPPRR